MNKICKKCNISKDIKNFYPTDTKNSRWICISCYKNNNKQYYLNKKDQINQKTKNYENNNKDKIRIRKKNYVQNRRKIDPCFKVANNLRKRINYIIKHKCKVGSAVKDLGCTIEELKLYLESKFTEEMSWENYGRKVGIKCWEIDHIVPLASFDLANREELLKACHYTNLQPLWSIDNLKKRDKINTNSLY